MTTHLKLALLGTAAGPVIWRGRMGMSSLLMVGDRGYLIDAGIGAAHRYRASGARWHQLSNIFITHMHSDHTLEIPQLMLVPWDMPTEAYESAVHIWGPGRHDAPPAAVNSVPAANLLLNPQLPMPGIEDFVARTFNDVFQGDINIRLRDEGRHDPRARFIAHDLDTGVPTPTAAATSITPTMDPFLVMEDDRVRVTATLVDHRLCFPALGYRFDTDAGSVVFSGDTCPHDNLIRLAEGADVLVHEVIHIDRCIESLSTDTSSMDELIEHWRESHTEHTEVGRVAADAGVRNLVLSHLAPGHVDMVSDAEWRAGARLHFDGPIHVGHDLDVIGVDHHAMV